MFEGRDLLTLTEHERRALRWRRMSFMPQTAMNALDPVQRLRAQCSRCCASAAAWRSAAALERAGELLRMVGLDPARLADYPHQF